MIREIVNIAKKRETPSSLPVKNFDANIRGIAVDLSDTMKNAGHKSMSGPHIGSQYRIAIVNLDLINNHSLGNGMLVMINPRVIDGLGDLYVEEEFLSNPGQYVPGLRSYISIVEYYDIHGDKNEITAVDELSVAIQHELDCINGLKF